MADDVKKMVRVDYNAYLADTDRLYDTTKADVAKEADIFNEKYTYAPMAYVVGSKKLFPALDAAIGAAEVGKEVEITIPCEEAAGVRDPKLLEVYPIRDFYKQEINPYPGLQVTLGNRTGVVMSAGAGRVKVDFNSPLAGHDLKYKFTVTEVIEDPVAKAKAIVEVSFGDAEGFEFKVKENCVSVKLPEVTKFSQEWTVARFAIVSDLREAFGVENVAFVEVWSSAKKDKKEE